MLLPSGRNLVSNCLPFQIAEADSTDGFRIGGNPPAGVVPSFQSPATRYFLTLPLEGGSELTLFMSLTTDLGPFDMLKTRYILHGEESNLIEASIHSAAPRADTSSFRSEIPSHAVQMLAERPDQEDDSPEDVWQEHKIGGRPAYYQYQNPILTDAKQLMASGYLHLLQISFPGSRDALLDVDWPFGQHVFHVFAKETADSLDLKYGWA